MKKKFLILTLCFTLIFSSINYKKSYADGGVISLPLLATVSSLAVGSGIILNSDDDIYDLGKLFYEYNKLNWDTVLLTFSTGVSVLNNKLISVDSKFLDIVKDFFDTYFSNTNTDITLSSFGLPFVGTFSTDKYSSYYRLNNFPISITEGTDVLVGDFRFVQVGYDDFLSKYSVDIYYKSQKIFSKVIFPSVPFSMFYGVYNKKTSLITVYQDASSSLGYKSVITPDIGSYVPSVSLPYNGGYTWDNVEDKKDDNSIALPIPGNLGQLVGQGSSDFWDNTDDLVGTGGITIPDVNDPSIPIGGDITFPNVSDIPSDTPSDTPFANITEYIIGLVVPSDTFWTDTFGGLYNNFTNSFPLVDMDNFNNLVTGEKKFPNIDINIMGVKGRVVNGDVVNSIVDWLRPIIAGFMMLCLMLFNYRKIYKTIRGVEPFQGIASGTSDFRTGISEYNYMGSGLSKADYEANEMELAKALHDHYQDTGKTYKVKI